MAKETGYNWVFAVDPDESDASPNWQDLSEQTSVSLRFGNTIIDATTKSTSGWRELLIGNREWGFSARGLSDQDNLGVIYCEFTNFTGAANANQKVHVRLTDADGDTFIGWTRMASWVIEAPGDGAVTYTAEFEGDGVLTVTQA